MEKIKILVTHKIWAVSDQSLVTNLEIIIIFIPWEFFTLAFADCLSLQDSTQYSGGSQ